MVFLSTLHLLLMGQGEGRPRSVFAFGYRQVTYRMLLEESIMGMFFIFPLSILFAHLTIRVAAAGWRPRFFRSDLWTTLIITVVGDLFLEVLLPSLRCLPLPDDDTAWMDDESATAGNNLNYMQWFMQTWGFGCPAEMDRQYLLSPDAVGTLLSLRLLFMCPGVYLGESFIPIALTGGIACGKSTVAQLLVDPKAAGSLPHPPDASIGAASSSKASSSTRQRRRKPKSTSTTTPATALTAEPSKPKGFLQFGSSEEEEGSFFMVDTDSIGHEILLPPAVLAGMDQDGKKTASSSYTVHPQDSVFPDIVAAFGDAETDNQNVLDENGLIDRRKLGAVIFADPTQRRVLNKITHPRIMLLMLKRILYGVFLSNQDVVCVDVPLLFEKGQLRWLFGLVIVVACSPATQLHRLRTRNPDLTEQQCRDRIASQMPMEQKVAMADICIMNDGDLEALGEQVEVVRRDVMGRVYGIGMSLLQMLLLVGGSLSLAVSSKLFSSWN